jgi:DNA-binding GntR family transcriptional regulator
MSDLTTLQLDIDLSQRRPLRDEAYVAIRRAIVNGDIKPGETLNERALAEQLGLSRSPIREAFRRLEQEGLVAFTRQHTVVQQLSLDRVIELYQIRQQLEGLVARLAARNYQLTDLNRLDGALNQMCSAIQVGNNQLASDEGIKFHEILADIAGNHRLASLLTSMTEEIQRFRHLYVKVVTRSQDALDEHRQILAAVAAKDEGLSEELMSEHIARALLYVQQQENYT